MSCHLRLHHRRWIVGLASAACVLMLGATPSPGYAGYPLDVPARVSLGFGATYRTADSTSPVTTHRGVDLSAETGSAVLSPLAGKVSFVGRVPSVGGGSALAVTIVTGSGSLTMMPLAKIEVAKGQALREGEQIASLAHDGDGSSGTTHLHVGLRRGDLYIDPMSALSAPAVQVASGGTARTGVQASPASAPRAVSAAVTSRGSRGVSAVDAPEAAPAAANSTAPRLHTATPGEVISSGVRIAGADAVRQEAPHSAGPASTDPRGGVHWARQSAAQGSAASAALAALVERARRAGTTAVRTAVAGSVAALGAVGLLWPLWRRKEEGSGEVCVSAVGDDVAAVAGR